MKRQKIVYMNLNKPTPSEILTLILVETLLTTQTENYDLILVARDKYVDDINCITINCQGPSDPKNHHYNLSPVTTLNPTGLNPTGLSPAGLCWKHQSRNLLRIYFQYLNNEMPDSTLDLIIYNQIISVYDQDFFSPPNPHTHSLMNTIRHFTPNLSSIQQNLSKISSIFDASITHIIYSFKNHQTVPLHNFTYPTQFNFKYSPSHLSLSQCYAILTFQEPNLDGLIFGIPPSYSFYSSTSGLSPSLFSDITDIISFHIKDQTDTDLLKSKLISCEYSNALSSFNISLL